MRRKERYLAELPPEKLLERCKAKKDQTAFRQRQAKIKQIYGDPVPTRLCHNPLCRKPTWDYYCPDCRKKNRARDGLDISRFDTESIWDGF